MSSVSPVSRSAGGWSRFLGLSLRPWSGESPTSLILRGTIQLAIALITTIFVSGMITESSKPEYRAYGDFRGLLIVLVIVFAVMGITGAARLAVGVLDLVPRRSAEGRVVSLTRRKAGDFLPYMAQRLIFERRSNGLDRRRERLEVVLETPDGLKQWTVRSSKARRALQVGSHVRLSTTPLTGYVARVDPLAS